MKSKICGIFDSNTLQYLTDHSNSPQYIGFIVNFPKSKRFVRHDKLKELLKIDKKNKKILIEYKIERDFWVTNFFILKRYILVNQKHS